MTLFVNNSGVQSYALFPGCQTGFYQLTARYDGISCHGIRRRSAPRRTQRHLYARGMGRNYQRNIHLRRTAVHDRRLGQNADSSYAGSPPDPMPQYKICYVRVIAYWQI